MPPRKRDADSADYEPEAETEAQKEEEVLDPKLASEPDVDDEEMAEPARKRPKTQKPSSNGSSAKSAPKKKPSASGSPHRSDFNPDGSLPESPTPLDTLRKKLAKQKSAKSDKQGNVVFWMRMRDLRISDSRGLAAASKLAKKHGKNLIVLHVLSPGDFTAHERSPRRIDFVLRTLKSLKEPLHKLDIPFVVTSVEPRTAIPEKVLEMCKEWGASDLFGNLEYEVDELWRDTQVFDKASSYGVVAHFLDDTYVVPPGDVLTKEGRAYSVFSPWNRNWTDQIAKRPDLLEASPDPSANDSSVHKDSTLGKLFDKADIPDHVKGFECEDREYMAKLWPEGEAGAQRVLKNFISGRGGKHEFEPVAAKDGDERVEAGAKDSKVARYGTGRNLMDENGSSRLSVYLSSGCVSARHCLRATKEITKGRLHVGRDTGPAMWNTEISFRDFYGHVLAAWPRVCMGRAYITKYEDVVWEQDEKMLQAWKEGKTGYPIVDASVRQGNKQGYMHNRGRMIAAMFLTKHLMQDWRLGEQHFMRSFIDGDFASNNGGWQWSASTGTDPQPYFRIFNPTSQSQKCDPSGDYIRHWVPELKSVKGAAIHEPFEKLSKKEFEKLGYPKPIVDHREARDRALRRFKNVGEK